MKATKRILQSQHNMTRAEAVMFHKEHGHDIETTDELNQKVVDIKNKRNEVKQKQKKKK